MHLIGELSMSIARHWSDYQANYRAPQMQIVAEWLVNGVSCAVVGMAGCGKSNFLGYLSQKPQVLWPYLGELAHKIVCVPVDLNGLPSPDLATFFRVVLRSFYEMRSRLSEEAAVLVQQQFLENKAATDPFLPQTALRELLLHFEAKEQRVVLVIDRFDRFADQASPDMADTLRNLRDSFKDTLCYVVGMRQAPKYLLNPEMLGELYEILDLHICWLGPMVLEDARRVIAEELRISEADLDNDLVAQIYSLTGGYPSLLKSVCQRYADSSPERADGWEQRLGADENIRYRLDEIWQGLTQQEQVLLYSLAQGEACPESELTSLVTKGLLIGEEGRWEIGASLLRDYAAERGRFSRGLLWEDEAKGVLYQGTRPLDHLPPLEAALLTFFVRYPYKRHTYTKIIEAVWADEANVAGVTNEALAKQISNLRKRIEPNATDPIYIINFRSKPEGGYVFYPEGKPT